jgi:hypothetical protein
MVEDIKHYHRKWLGLVERTPLESLQCQACFANPTWRRGKTTVSSPRTVLFLPLLVAVEKRGDNDDDDTGLL